MLTYRLTLLITIMQEEMTETPSKLRRGTMPGRRERERSAASLDWTAFNQRMKRDCDSAPVSVFSYQDNGQAVLMVAVSRNQVLTAVEVEKEIEARIREMEVSLTSCQVMELQEITLSECCSALLQGENNDLLRNAYAVFSSLGLVAIKEQVEPVRRRDECRMDESMARAVFLTKKGALSHVKEIMGHSTLKKEMERIYHGGNHRCYIEHPVHYFVRASSRHVAQEMIDALVGGLYANGRLLSKRMAYFCDFETNCSRARYMKGMLAPAGYSTVAIELSSKDPATGSRSLHQANEELEFHKFLMDDAIKNNRDTLFIFVVISEQMDKLAQKFLREISEAHDMVVLLEGEGKETDVRAYLHYMAAEKKIPTFIDEDIDEFLPAGTYTASKAEKIFEQLCRKRLHRDYFPAYGLLEKVTEWAEGETTEEEPKASQRLQQLVGLGNIKSLTERILAAHKMKQLRQELNMKGNQIPLHMVFTGNPGTAKTTVARLLAGIMKEDKISTTGAFVECGRSDLVGKYVGWTAKIVKEKFKEASGGILFIDEAYSLLDDSNSFGAEAINTIVQEMENHRDDVLVIFAGYPDMMNDFIDSNAGLRSRIAFHVDFPDYDVDELNEILCVMAKDRGYRLNQGIRKKCRGIFADVVKEKNFGNGRYVRNLLDAAILHQAERLMRTRQNITRQKAYCLTMEDFHKVRITTRKPKLHMGFQKRYASDDSTDI